MTAPEAKRVLMARRKALSRRRSTRPTCEDCHRPLSIYNPSALCGPCSFRRR